MIRGAAVAVERAGIEAELHALLGIEKRVNP
jgi:hypothetical protein